MGSPLAGMICHEVESVARGIGMYEGSIDAVVMGGEEFADGGRAADSGKDREKNGVCSVG